MLWSENWLPHPFPYTPQDAGSKPSQFFRSLDIPGGRSAPHSCSASMTFAAKPGTTRFQGEGRCWFRLNIRLNSND